MIHGERGATAVVVAASMIVLLGMAAIAIDLGAGFNERNQDQTAGDNSAMAGALEVTFQGTSSDVATEALTVARANLDTAFGVPADPNDSSWVELWRSCSDPAKSVAFQPVDEPIGWTGVVTTTPSTGTIDCISRAPSFLRVRIPDQVVDTTFGRVIGTDQINTSAVSIARIAPAPNTAPLVPYGISGGFGNGEACFGTAPSGTAFEPCNGSSSGSFGTLLSEFFGDFYGSVDCKNPGADEISTGTAIGVDHFIEEWSNPGGAVTAGSAHPGDGTVLALTDTNRDACNDVGGVAVGVDGPSVNTVRVDTGFPSAAMENGLVSNMTFYGQPSRLQQGSGNKQIIVARRAGANETLWNIDDEGPWDHLTDAVSSPVECRSSSYVGLPTVDPDPLISTKVSLFADCLAAYSGPADIFDATSLATSPRLVWAPQYWYDVSTTGTSWQPVQTYRMSFIGGTFYNCSGSACDIVHYPDADPATNPPELCDASGGGCQQLSLDQFSAWVLPDEAVPDVIRNTFPGGASPFAPELWQ